MFAYHRLLSCVTEHLLAEIVQLTVSDITKAIEWLKRSYLYVRMKKASDPGYQLVLFISLPSHLMQFFMHNQNPMNYAIKKGISGDRLEKHVQGTVVIIRLSFVVFYFLLSPFLFLLRVPRHMSLNY